MSMVLRNFLIVHLNMYHCENSIFVFFQRAFDNKKYSILFLQPYVIAFTNTHYDNCYNLVQKLHYTFGQNQIAVYFLLLLATFSHLSVIVNIFP